MSADRAAGSAAQRVGSGAGRIVRAWRTLPAERRLAVYAGIGLFVALFLPWYQRHFFVVVAGKLQPAADSQTGWGAFSFVEAAVLLVAAGVLTLLFQRAEGRAFHLPGGDGWVITAAGFWTCVLVVWRIFDKQSATSHAQNATTYGIEWGIFVALAVAAFLAYAGTRIRAAHRPEPPLPGDDQPPFPSDDWSARDPQPDPPPRRRMRPPRPVAADDPPTRRIARPSSRPPADSAQASEQPTRRLRGSARRAAADRSEGLGPAPEWSDPVPEWPPSAAPRPAAPPSAGEPDSEPERSPASDRVTDPASDRGRDPRPGPSTPAARRARQPDDQLTIPLERDE